ncbi:MAG: glycosyltransferase family 4 protein [Nanoarchaeota archaeon]
MKILEVVHRFPPAVGGSEKVVYELSKELVKKGHAVTVLTTTSLHNNDTKGFSTGRPFSLRSATYKKKKEILDGIKVIRTEPDFQFWTFAPNREMKRFLKKHIHEYGIIHVHGYQTYESALVSKMATGYVHTAHDIISHYPGVFALMKSIYDRFIGRRILKNAGALIALTEENKRQYVEICDCSSKIHIIPNGITPFRQRPKDKGLMKKFGNPKNILLFVGRIVEYKGCQHTIRALPNILKEEPETIALFVGKDGGYAKTLQRIAREEGVENQCFFTGAVEDLEKYLNLGDIFVFPSRGEGFGLAPVEAMSIGIPAVLADMGGLRYVLKDIGGYPINMEKDIEKQITDHVLSIIKHPPNKKEIVKKTQPYRWDTIAERTVEVFTSTTAKKK